MGRHFKLINGLICTSLIFLGLSSCNQSGEVSLVVKSGDKGATSNTGSDPSGSSGSGASSVPDSSSSTSSSGGSSSSSSDLAPSDCPSLFIPVPGNTDYSVSDFCVMKYEARNDGSGNAILDESALSNAPYGNVTGNNAFSKCNNYSQNGFDGTFTLISNAEWMTIARNIELVDDNWSSGTRGSGKLYVGHTDSSPYSALASSSDDSLGYYLTNNNATHSLGSGFEQKRTLVLSNSQVIWDFAGNLAEWVDWDGSNSVYDVSYTNTGNTFRDIIVLAGSMTALELQSAFNYGQNEYAGAWYGASSGQGSAYRGGFYYIGATKGGVFTLSANLSANSTRAHMGFRCVYRP